MAKYNLLDIPLKQAFANSGITQRVPYQLNPNDDELNWLEGFTDSYQRPVVAYDTQQGNGRYIKMGQLNQIFQNLSQAMLNIEQGLNNVSQVIDENLANKVQEIVNDAKTLLNKKTGYLKITTNQNCAGLKNFTGVNIDNFKNIKNAVANLEWCNGFPNLIILGAENYTRGTNYTATKVSELISFFYTALYGKDDGKSCRISRLFLNNVLYTILDECLYKSAVKKYTSNAMMFVSKGDVYRHNKTYIYLGEKLSFDVISKQGS